MTPCRERGGHRWANPHATRTVCLSCGVTRTVRRGKHKQRPKVIYSLPATHAFEPDADGLYCLRCKLPEHNQRHSSGHEHGG